MESRLNQLKSSKNNLKDNRNSKGENGSIGNNLTLKKTDSKAALYTRKSSNQSKDNRGGRHGSLRDDAERGRDA
jgi:hypothetical protein